MKPCPFCGSMNIECEMLEMGDGPMAGAAQNGPMSCLDCEAGQDEDGEWLPVSPNNQLRFGAQ